MNDAILLNTAGCNFLCVVPRGEVPCEMRPTEVKAAETVADVKAAETADVLERFLSWS